MKPNLFGSLDMGTTKVSAMVGERYGGGVRIIGFGSTASEGFKQGVVVDIEQATQSAATAVRDAERMAGISLTRYSVGVAGEHIRSMNSRGVVGIADPGQEISRADVARSLGAARNFALPDDREIIHTLPQQYIIDNQGGIREPYGMYGSRLEARAHVVTASRPALDNIAKVMDNAGLVPGEFVLECLASSRAVLGEDERAIGVMLIDIGGGTTDIIVHSDGGVVASGVIGIGGNNITSDIAYGLRTSMHSAERLKIEHGCALSSMVPTSDQIEVEGVGNRDAKKQPRQLLSGIIEPRVKELFTLINEQISENDFRTLLGAGVVLTGGSSMLEGTRELAEQIFDLPVRIGAPEDVEGLVEVVSHPMYATGVGLLFFDGDLSGRRTNRDFGQTWWKQSFSQLRRAIAGFI